MTVDLLRDFSHPLAMEETATKSPSQENSPVADTGAAPTTATMMELLPNTEEVERSGLTSCSTSTTAPPATKPQKRTRAGHRQTNSWSQELFSTLRIGQLEAEREMGGNEVLVHQQDKQKAARRRLSKTEDDAYEVTNDDAAFRQLQDAMRTQGILTTASLRLHLHTLLSEGKADLDSKKRTRRHSVHHTEGQTVKSARDQSPLSVAGVLHLFT